MGIKIVAVVVTYNRLEKLRKALDCYEKQTTSVDNIIVVNNNSTDGTFEYLQKWLKGSNNRHVINMVENLGGSAGFHDGCKKALELNPDWVFVSDDDAYLDTDAISLFEQFVKLHKTENYSAICGAVLSTDGEYVLSHRRTEKIVHHVKPIFESSTKSDYNKEFFDINTFSYVGTFLKAASLKNAGLCIRDFFIYFDDSEHSIRMMKEGRIVCVPKVRIVHDDGFTLEKSASTVLSWRDYYSIRNMLYSYIQHKPVVGLYLILRYLYHNYILHERTGEERKLYNSAIKDAIRGKLGKHVIYRPSFSIA